MLTDGWRALLACPSCRGTLSTELVCDGCGRGYAWEGEVPVLVGAAEREAMTRAEGAWARWSEAIRGLDAWRARRAKHPVAKADSVDPRIVALLAQAAPRGVVADVGGANGDKLRAMPIEVTRYVSLDPFAHHAPPPREGTEAMSVRAIAEALPLADASVDTVFSTGAMDYFVDPPRAVREFARVLRPSGTLALLVTVHPPPVARARTASDRLSRLVWSLAPSVIASVGARAALSLAWDGALARDREHTRYLTEPEVLEWLDDRFETVSLARDAGRYSTVLRVVGRVKTSRMG